MRALFLFLLSLGIFFEGGCLLNSKKYSYTYYSDGHILKKYILKNNVYEDTSFVYYDNGKLFDEKVWLHGQLNGIARSFYPNGKVMSVGPFRDSLKSGEWFYYDSLGQLKSKKEFFVIHQSSYILNRFRYIQDSDKYTQRCIDYDIDYKIDTIIGHDSLFDYSLSIKCYDLPNHNIRVIFGKLGEHFSNFSQADTIYPQNHGNAIFIMRNIPSNSVNDFKGILQGYKDTIYEGKHFIDAVNSYFVFKRRIGWQVHS